jgi:hypothetical protein
MAVASVAEQISNFGDQIQNLLEKAVRMIYRLSLFGKNHISQNVAEG